MEQVIDAALEEKRPAREAAAPVPVAVADRRHASQTTVTHPPWSRSAERKLAT